MSMVWSLRRISISRTGVSFPRRRRRSCSGVHGKMSTTRDHVDKARDPHRCRAESRNGNTSTLHGGTCLKYYKDLLGLLRNMLSLQLTPSSSPQDWRVIESLAEEHPYVAALLSGTRDYICTGSIISRRSILTSGSCVSYNPKYVLVSSAMYNKRLNNNTVFEVSFTKLHGDYIFDLKTSDPNVTRMHSNIGLVFVSRPLLELFVNAADIGNYYASELKEKKLIAVGYGRLGTSDTVALQHQAYHQTPCTNPKWYYCVCGIEYSTYTRTYTYEFGTGAPVLYGNELVGITATPCGTLSMKNLGIKYNIFTVIGPYLPWIDKSQTNNSVIIEMRATTNGSLRRITLNKYFTIILLVISKALA